ncbi:MAG: LCP family protein [Candidatus Peribacteraceae bacterium]|nr:LCP family protein [Candidatus Peribacteraceae bacterium]
MSFTVRRVREDEQPSALRKSVRFGLGLVTSSRQLWHHFQERKEADQERQSREHTLKRTVTILLSVLLSVLLLAGALNILLRLKSFATDLFSVAGATLPKDEDGFTNVLLLGVGDNDHDGVDLTDTIMVASIDAVRTKSVVLLSIPRDTYILSSEKMAKGRINSLYRDYKNYLIHRGTEKKAASLEALRQLGEEISTFIGLPIHGVVKINFSGFIQGVDALGGIDIAVPEDIVDPEYPGPDYSYETFRISKGPQHMSGAIALRYVRTRHTTSDFSRSARQQQVIAAIGRQAKSAGLLSRPATLTGLFGIVADNVETTFGVRELISLAQTGKALDPRRVISVQLSDQSGLTGGIPQIGGFLYPPPREQFDGASVLLPLSIPEFPVTWNQVRAFGSILFRHRSLFLDPPHFVVVNAGAKPGSAFRLAGELTRFGFPVVKTGNLEKKNNPSLPASSIVFNPLFDQPEHEKAKERVLEEAAFLSELLGIPLVSSTDPRPFADGDGDIGVILGKDFTFAPLQDRLAEVADR